MRVETYSSFAYAVAPRAFEFNGAVHRVESITRAWRTPGQIHFYLCDTSREFFQLSYHEPDDVWTMRAFGRNCSIPNKVKFP